MGTKQVTNAHFYVLVNSSDKRNVWHTIFGGCVCLEKADWDMMVSQCKDYNWYSTYSHTAINGCWVWICCICEIWPSFFETK